MPTDSLYCAGRVSGCQQSPDCAGILRIAQTPCGIGQPVPGKGRPPQAIPSPISRHIITCYVRYQGSKYTANIYIYIYIYIYTLVQTIICVQAKLEVVRRKHIVHLTGFGAYSSTCCKETTMPAPWETISPHPPRSGCRHSTMPATTTPFELRDMLPPQHSSMSLYKSI